jgi:hypothetical protein
MSTNSTPSWSALKRKDLRRTRRWTVEGAFLRVSWLDPQGSLRMAQRSRVLNVSEEGIAFELPEPAQLGSRVKIQADKHRLLGEATVRHCRRVGPKYVVGVEFVDGLRWKAPEEDVPEPITLTDMESSRELSHD